MKSLFVLVALISCVVAETEYTKCDESKYYFKLPIIFSSVSLFIGQCTECTCSVLKDVKASDDICEINAVTITPCPSKGYCKLKKGKDANISFDFTPNFAATKMNATLFWASPNGDVAFPSLSNGDACTLTGCPLESGKRQELNYNLRISKIFPSGKFLLKWHLFNEENKKQLCCFKTQIMLRK